MLPETLTSALAEADRLGLKDHKSYVAFHIGKIMEIGCHDDLVNQLLLELQKRDSNRIMSFEKYLLGEIEQHKAKESHRAKILPFTPKHG